MSLESQIKFHVRRVPILKKILKKLLRIDTTNQQLAELERKLIFGYILPLERRVRALEGPSSPAPRILGFGDNRPVSFANVTSQAVTMKQMQEPTYLAWCERLREIPNFHRKQWEYYYILKALEQEKKLGPGMSGLGFGVGKDPIVAYMVKQGCKIVATDLDPTSAYDKGWAQTNQYSEKLLNLNEKRICSDNDLKKQVRLRNVNMNEIPDDLRQGQYDFVWSACAYEHLGSIEKGLQFVVDAMDCLKPGGVAVHTTELNLSSLDQTLTEGDTVIFRKKDFEELAERLRAKGYEIDLNFNIGEQPLDQFYDVPPYSEFNHLKLMLQSYITTSYGIIVRKPISH